MLARLLVIVSAVTLVASIPPLPCRLMVPKLVSFIVETRSSRLQLPSDLQAQKIVLKIYSHKITISEKSNAATLVVFYWVNPNRTFPSVICMKTPA